MRRFAETAESIAATTSKLEKVRLLAEYLQSLDETRVGVAARFFSGLVFPTWDMRVLSVGGFIAKRIHSSGAPTALSAVAN